MLHLALENVTYLADIVDPTSDGILNRIGVFFLNVLKLVVVFWGAWLLFKHWLDGGDKADSNFWKGAGKIVAGVVVVEGILFAIPSLATYGQSIVGNLNLIG